LPNFTGTGVFLGENVTNVEWGIVGKIKSKLKIYENGILEKN